jgi:hypothetical protein
MSDPFKANDSSLDRLREAETKDRQNEQVSVDTSDDNHGDAKTLKEAADDADSEQGIGQGVKSSGDVKN